MDGQFLPSEWSFEGISVRDVRFDEVSIVAELHGSRAAVGDLDSAFNPVELEEYAGLVQASNEGVLEGKAFRLQLILYGGEPCGYFHATSGIPHAGSLFIGIFFVTPDLAGQGVGKRVVSGLAEVASGLGFSRMLCNVYLKNLRALRFWVGQGFDHIDKVVIMEDSGEPDRMVLERRL